MKRNGCQREADVLAAVRSGWCDEELRSHFEVCDSCRELYAVASLVFDDSKEAAAGADIPSSGLAWWRIQLRQRREAARRAGQTMTAVQAVFLVAAVIATATIFGGQLLTSSIWIDALQALAPWRLPILAGLGSCMLLASYVVYSALARER